MKRMFCRLSVPRLVRLKSSVVAVPMEISVGATDVMSSTVASRTCMIAVCLIPPVISKSTWYNPGGAVLGILNS